MTQKDLDKKVADKLEDFVCNLSSLADVRGKMSDIELTNVKACIRYAIASLRVEKP